MRRNRLRYLFGCAIVVACGLASRRYAAFLPTFIARYAGDALWAVVAFGVIGTHARPIALVLVALLATSACTREQTLETVKWRGHVFHEVRGLADLPAWMQSRLGVSLPDGQGVADRGRPFNPSDVVDGRPMRRLLAAGRDGSTWIVVMEIGGLGYSVEVYLYSTPEAAPTERWTLPGSPKTLSEALQRLP